MSRARVHGELQRLALACTREADASTRAIGWNLRCDHRISHQRAEHFLTTSSHPGSPRELMRAMVDYFRDWVCRDPDQTYLSPVLNARNLLAKSKVPADLELAHVLNVTSWVDRLSSVPKLGDRLRMALATLDVATSPPDEIGRFLEDLFHGINAYRDRRPVWVAAWPEFERLIDLAVPETWNAVVGVWRNRGALQVVLRYPVGSVVQLVRPTQLDVGYYQYHFPSPPRLRVAWGGFAMALRRVEPDARLVPEWLHPPADLSVAQWNAAGRLCGYTNGGLGSLAFWSSRRQHGERLERRFPKASSGWLPPV
jgi:hypothetical protein